MDTARTGADQEVASTPDAERERLRADAANRERWKEWGPYLSERQWGTVREDYSAGGTAWEYFPHDHARSRAYRWGEDGIAGFSRRRAAALPVARAVERPRPDPEGAAVRPHQHRRAITARTSRKLYYYLDATPTHSYLQDALQVSAAGVSLRGPRDRERGARHESAGIRAARHRSIRRQSLFRRLRRVRARRSPTTS